MKNESKIHRKPSAYNIASLLLIATITATGVGCASASAKLDSKRDYRQAQVQAIKVQREADVIAQQHLSAERVAMWQALSEAVKHNPESASNLAIVAAVASSRSDSGTVTTGKVTTLTAERDVHAIDYVKVLAPGLIGGITQAGISAIANETTRASIKANRDVRIAEVGVDGQIIGAINNAIDELDDNELAQGSDFGNTDPDDGIVPTDPSGPEEPVEPVEPVVDPCEEMGDCPVDGGGDDFYNDTAEECAALGLTLVQTTWGLQCQ